MEKPVLYVSTISPTCQRVFITLANKGLDYKSVEIDLRLPREERPEEFLAISRQGQVPALTHNGNTLVQSGVICQYIDDVWPEVPMMPKSAGEAAYARQWIHFADSEIMDKDIRVVHFEKELERKHQMCKELFNGLVHLDAELAKKDAFFLGSELSIVDAMFAPQLRLLPIIAELSDDTTFRTYRHIQAYRERLLRHPAIEKTILSVPEDVYRGFFTAVLKDGLCA
ncbi:Glutathione S-transferase [Burkholderia sp. OK233]|nr:Glutathione S-transferase [Burkholderia sp. OK233]